MKARWLALHPYAFYSDFADFSLWRIEPEAILFAGSFARARRLKPDELLADLAAASRVAAAAEGIIAVCNSEHAEALEAIATASGGWGRGWRMVALDVDGCDLASGETVLRVPFLSWLTDPAAVHNELIGLAERGHSAI